MRGHVRQRMIEGAAQVLGRRGLHATAFSEVLALTGTSRGSIYHHFPGGKAELIGAVIEEHGAWIDDRLQDLHGQPLAAVIEGAMQIWRAMLIRSDCESGCPVLAVVVAADSMRLLQDCQLVLDQWVGSLSAALRAAGVAAAPARDFATMLLAGVQGGVVLARAQGRIEPFDAVAAQLHGQARALAA